MQALKAAIPVAADTTSKKTMVQWLQMCRDAEKEYMDKFDVERKFYGDEHNKLTAAQEALRIYGTHNDDCNAVKKIGRFGSRKGLKWSVADDDAKSCSCGLAKALL